MDIRQLQRAIVDGLEDVKAHNIRVFNTEHLSPLFERVIVASGNSNRQTKALASSVRDTVRKRGLQVLRTEGEENGEWIIVDCGAAVAHIMQPAVRDYYNLEEIWGSKPVTMKAPARKDGASAAPKASKSAPKKVTAAKARVPAGAGDTKPLVKKAAKKLAKAPPSKAGAKSKSTKPTKPMKAVATTAKTTARSTTKVAPKTVAKPTTRTAAKTTSKVSAKGGAKTTRPRTTRKV
jgi:ribosome-associated protein